MKPGLPSVVRWTTILSALFLVVGCGSKSAFTDEMRQQETEMTNETSDWQSQVAQWENDFKDMHEWNVAHPVPSGGSPDADDIKHHDEKTTDHTQQVKDFETELAAHEQKLKDESSKPEKDRTLAHAALWADHMKLKTSFAMLRGAHEDLSKEHAELVAKAASPKKTD